MPFNRNATRLNVLHQHEASFCATYRIAISGICFTDKLSVSLWKNRIC